MRCIKCGEYAASEPGNLCMNCWIEKADEATKGLDTSDRGAEVARCYNELAAGRNPFGKVRKLHSLEFISVAFVKVPPDPRCAFKIIEDASLPPNRVELWGHGEIVGAELPEAFLRPDARRVELVKVPPKGEREVTLKDDQGRPVLRITSKYPGGEDDEG